jgi:hypothetical protein
VIGFLGYNIQYILNVLNLETEIHELLVLKSHYGIDVFSSEISAKIPRFCLCSCRWLMIKTLGFFSSFLGVFIYVLVIAYHYVMADPKYEGS